ncbi:MAG: hypothetical protein LBG19_07955 [Prevotellaceae bacterium]|jgi:hypothetical protein|nr:hypothetical protein [Prevotellaceae bacterium]
MLKKEEFDGYVEKRYSEWLTDDSILEPEDDGKSLFYTDAGSETWRRLVDNGILTGEQAIPVAAMPMPETVLEIVKLCKEQQDVECAAEWFRTTLFYILWDAKEKDTQTIDAIAKILFNEVVLAAVYEDYYFQRSINSLKEEIDNNEAPKILTEWIKAYIDWEQELEKNPNFHLQQTIKKFRDKDLKGAYESCKKGLENDPDNPFLLLYEATIYILILQNARQDIESYQSWIDQLQKPLFVENQTEENIRIIKSHSLYYIAYAYLICGNLSEAKKIAEQVINEYKMEEAKELLDFIIKAETQQ